MAKYNWLDERVKGILREAGGTSTYGEIREKGRFRRGLIRVLESLQATGIVTFEIDSEDVNNTVVTFA